MALLFACHVLELHNDVIVMTEQSFICTAPAIGENFPLLLRTSSSVGAAPYDPGGFSGRRNVALRDFPLASISRSRSTPPTTQAFVRHGAPLTLRVKTPLQEKLNNTLAATIHKHKAS